MTPKPYLSQSSMILLEKNPEKWKEVYLYGGRMPINRGMAFGKKMATALENDEDTDDIELNAIMVTIPKFEVRDKIIQDPNGVEVEYYNRETDKIEIVKLPYIKDGNTKIPILCKPDTSKLDLTGFKEYKTSQKRWTQRQVDENDQITFYATGMYLITKKIPIDIELDEIETMTNEKGQVVATGKVYRHHTVRSMSQILNMMVRMKKAWSTINKICEEELI